MVGEHERRSQQVDEGLVSRVTQLLVPFTAPGKGHSIMTSNHAHKQLIRDRMAATGETYTQARQQLEPEPPTTIKVSIPLGTINLTKEQQEAWLAAERDKEGSGHTVVNGLYEAHIRRLTLEALSAFGDFDSGNAADLEAYLDIDFEELEEAGIIESMTYHKSEEDARYAAFHGHKARALGLTVEEYRERERWLMTDLTSAEYKWLVDTGRFGGKEGDDYIYINVGGELVSMEIGDWDEKLLQFLAEYKEAHAS